MSGRFRFKTGDKVTIRRDIPSPFAGLNAIVETIEPNDRNVSVLDRYVVVFLWGEKHSFYEAQLVEGVDAIRPADPPSGR